MCAEHNFYCTSTGQRAIYTNLQRFLYTKFDPDKQPFSEYPFLLLRSNSHLCARSHQKRFLVYLTLSSFSLAYVHTFNFHKNLLLLIRLSVAKSVLLLSLIDNNRHSPISGLVTGPWLLSSIQCASTLWGTASPLPLRISRSLAMAEFSVKVLLYVGKGV